MKEPLLKIENLEMIFKLSNKKIIKPVNNISFVVNDGETVGIVGESGSGKSTLANCIMQLLPKTGKIIAGNIFFKGNNLIGMSHEELRKIRGAKIALIPQNPMSSFDPIVTIEKQMKEIFLVHLKDKISLLNKEIKEKKNILKQAEKNFNNNPSEENKKILEISQKELDKIKETNENYIFKRSVELLKLVGINDPEKRLKQYSTEMSGGMLQRVAIAMSLICEPSLLIADEPTTALDVTVQAQIISLLKFIQKKMKMGIIIITHDLGIIANMCDVVNVMYAGSIVETGEAKGIFKNPKHEYTKKLILSTPKLDTKELVTIEGNPTALSDLPEGCCFSERCENCMKICLKKKPPLLKVKDNHYSACFNYMYQQYKENKISESEIKNLLKNI